MATPGKRTILRRVVEQSTWARPLPELLDFVLAEVETGIGFTWAAIWLFDPREESWYIAVSRGLSLEAAEIRFPRAFALPCLVGERGQPLLIGDLDDQDFHRYYPEHDLMRSALYAPMSLGDRTCGVIALYSDHRQAFGDSDLQLLTTIGDHLGLAVAFATLEEQRERLAILESRDRLAKDLHDGILQVLSSMKIYTSELGLAVDNGDRPLLREILEQLDSTVDTAMTELRDAIDRLRLDCVSEQVVDVATRTAARLDAAGIQTTLEITAKNLPGNVSDALAWICREAANNILKHSNAGHAAIIIEMADSAVEMCVADDGDGLRYDRSDDGHLQLGIQVMRERAVALGGTLAVENEGRGVSVRCRMPLP